MVRKLFHRIIMISLAFAAIVPAPAVAVSDGAPQSRAILTVMSARAAGMGEVTSVLDDATVGIWWNPGMAALDRKARYNRTSSDLAMGLADDISMKTWSISSGRIPVGPVSFTIGLGKAKLDLGTSTIILEDGSQLGSFDSYDNLRNVLLAASWKGIIGAGIVWEHTKSVLSPSIQELGINCSKAEISGTSFGIGLKPVVRYDMQSDKFGLWEEYWTEKTAPGIVFSPMLGWSYLHSGDDVVYNDQSQPDPQPKQTHRGYGFKFRIDAGTTGELLDPRRLLRLDFLWGMEDAKSQVGWKDKIDLDGYEITLGGIFSIRRGNIDDPSGHITDSTEGWGIGLEEIFPIGFRYDEAKVPQAEDLPDVTRKEFMLTADLVEFIALFKGTGGAEIQR